MSKRLSGPSRYGESGYHGAKTGSRTSNTANNSRASRAIDTGAVVPRPDDYDLAKRLSHEATGYPMNIWV